MTAPDFLVSVLDTIPPDLSGDLSASVAGTVAVACAAEAAGYHRFWVAEHHASITSVCGQPAVLVGLLAGRTRRIRIGSGGVMLPNHSPLAVAEQFTLLAACHGDRIDLGIGRAAGADPLTLQALGRRAGAEEDEGFLADVTALAGFLTGSWADGHPYAGIATPRAAAPPPIHLLGASVGSAELAARAGYPYFFGRKLAPRLTAPATRAYRRAWSESGHPGAAPLAVMCGVICADTQAEADRAALVAGLTRVRAASALEAGTLPSLAELADPHCTEEERAQVTRAYAGGAFLIGDGERVASGLRALAASTGAVELMLTSFEFGAADRSRSLAAIAGSLGLTGAEMPTVSRMGLAS